jgi:hypothetical protein
MKVIYAANVADSELATGNAMVEKVHTHIIMEIGPKGE